MPQLQILVEIRTLDTCRNYHEYKAHQNMYKTDINYFQITKHDQLRQVFLYLHTNRFDIILTTLFYIVENLKCRKLLIVVQSLK